MCNCSTAVCTAVELEQYAAAQSSASAHSSWAGHSSAGALTQCGRSRQPVPIDLPAAARARGIGPGRRRPAGKISGGDRG